MEVSSERLAHFLENFAHTRILIIGDVILDKYMHGAASRISPEAPVPIVHITKETLVPGGAANSAHNIATLGGEAYLVGLIGADSTGETMKQLLTEKKIHAHLVLDETRPTILKTRVVAQNQQIVRIDHEKDLPISYEIEQRVMNTIKQYLDKVDVVLISDYSKGLLTHSLARQVIGACNQAGKRIIVDTKQRDVELYKGAYLLTPNLKEASDITKIDPRSEEDVMRMGQELVSAFSAHILITRGKEGMTLFHANQRTHLSAKAKEVFDVSGAGDTVASVIALGLAAGASLEEAMILANHAAGIVVGKFGTATVSLEELRGEIMGETYARH